jgi:hypothetical protein
MAPALYQVKIIHKAKKKNIKNISLDNLDRGKKDIEKRE